MSRVGPSTHACFRTSDTLVQRVGVADRSAHITPDHRPPHRLSRNAKATAPVPAETDADWQRDGVAADWEFAREKLHLDPEPLRGSRPECCRAVCAMTRPCPERRTVPSEPVSHISTLSLDHKENDCCQLETTKPDLRSCPTHCILLMLTTRTMATLWHNDCLHNVGMSVGGDAVARPHPYALPAWPLASWGQQRRPSSFRRRAVFTCS